MCQPFNEHQPVRDEFHGLLLYVVALSSLYFMFHVYKPKPQQSKSASQNNNQSSNLSSSQLEYQKSHKFREEQRAKYRKHKSLKRKTQDDKGSQGSLLGRSLTLKAFNLTPLSTPNLAKRHSIFTTTQSSSMSSMRAGESSLANSNDQLPQTSKDSSLPTSNMFSYHNQSTPSSMNTKSLRFQESRNDTRAVSFDTSDVYEKERRQTSSKYFSNLRQSYDEGSNNSKIRSNTLLRHDAFDAGKINDLGLNQGAQKQILVANGIRNKNRNESDRKTSLRRKALSVEMIKHSSEESNTICAYN